MADSTEPNSVIEQLWNSLCRAGGHWAEDVLLIEEGEKFEAYFYIEDTLPSGAASHIRNYAQSFLALQGWTAKTKLTRHYLRVELSKA